MYMYIQTLGTRFCLMQKDFLRTMSLTITRQLQIKKNKRIMYFLTSLGVSNCCDCLLFVSGPFCTKLLLLCLLLFSGPLGMALLGLLPAPSAFGLG